MTGIRREKRAVFSDRINEVIMKKSKKYDEMIMKMIEGGYGLPPINENGEVEFLMKERSVMVGWECPKCGSVLSPFQAYCMFCSLNEKD